MEVELEKCENALDKAVPLFQELQVAFDEFVSALRDYVKE